MVPDSPERTELERKLGDLMQQHYDLVNRLAQDQQYFRRLARSVWRVQEEERRRLARDLHDGIGQNLTALVHLLNNALDNIPAAQKDARTSLEKSRALAVMTLDETRALSRLLRPQILDDLGLEAALRWLTRTYAETHGLSVILDIGQPMPPLENDQATLIFRVVQEALTNVVRHSQATQVTIKLEHKNNDMIVDVIDNGIGCNIDDALTKGREGQSAGIGGMRDRVRLFSGHLTLHSQRGAGFCVTMKFPLPAPPEAQSG